MKEFDPQGHKGQMFLNWIFGFLRVQQWTSKNTEGSYKVPWRPIGIRFWETTTPEPEKGPAGQKISSDKKTLKIKVEAS